jgi:hypothetical protein
MSLGVPLHDALREKQAPHSLCRACSLEVPATLIEPECEIDRVLLRILRRKAGGAVEAPLPRAARSNDRPLSASAHLEVKRARTPWTVIAEAARYRWPSRTMH